MFNGYVRALTWPHRFIRFTITVSEDKVFIHSGYFMLLESLCNKTAITTHSEHLQHIVHIL